MRAGLRNELLKSRHPSQGEEVQISKSFAKAKIKAQAVQCMNNTKQLIVGLQLYADDHDGFFPYNLGMNGSSMRTNVNW